MTSDGSIRFDGQVVVVTGAGGGLGREYARAFAGRGADVVVNDISAEGAAETASAITREGGSAVAVAGDVVADARQTVATALDTFGRLDVLVNNAGIAHDARFGPGALEDVTRLVHVHAFGTVAMTEASWDALRASSGRIVNICSGAVFGLPGSAAYSSAKGAILGLTKALASERHTSGVTVNGVMPMARTRMYEAAGGVVGSDEDQLMTQHFPAEAVAPVVAYLGWQGVPWNGEIFEVAGRAVSRIVFASGPTIEVRAPEDVADNIETLDSPEFHAVGSLAESVGEKLMRLMAPPTADTDRRD